MDTLEVITTDFEDCEACGGIGYYISLPGDVFSHCPYCKGKGQVKKGYQYEVEEE